MKLHATKVGGVFVFADNCCRLKLRLHAAKAGGVFGFLHSLGSRWMPSDPLYNTRVKKDLCALANDLEQLHSTPFASARKPSGHLL